MKSNLRGDSGLSDSGFYRSQKFFLEKHKETLDKIERCSIMELRRRRFEANAKPPRRKKSLWKRIKEWFGAK
ncbi:MAG: hypothetical protein FI729_00830 [SAR202 cluster bacterium]|nr:hypothetical protein [SAR202 cluster bacterium]|tara:strand:- start:1406 stop:1621 length:216 start_codon:yes stop_codon:yes gene_type:complete